MRVTKEVPVPAKTETQLEYVQCELCGTRSERDDWSPGQYKIHEPEVTLRIGDRYPEGGSTKTTVLDICPKCFKDKLIPWFQSQGGKPRVEESDW